MAYQAPAITATGLTVPSYQDILDDLIAQMKSIYGQDIYLGTDSSDYQMLSIIALKIADCGSVLQATYNSRTPSGSIGVALDSIIKLNGITRKAASYSTCVVTITGTAGTIINNGVVSDINGNKWNLPPVVTISGGGTVDVTVICQTIGAIAALATNINTISTPTSGWISVSNANAASPGQPVETDTQLRVRQALSTEKPSMTLLSGTISAIASLPGVTRQKVYENPTGATDSNGLPAHSIAAVVEGGVTADIAMSIYDNRGIGPLTDGTTTTTVTDPVTGQTMDISFYRPSYKAIDVVIQVHNLTGYTDNTRDAIKAAVAAYLNSLEIGSDLSVFSIYSSALSAVGDPSNPLYYIRSINACLHGGTPATTDIAIAFNEVTTGSVADITINLV